MKAYIIIKGWGEYSERGTEPAKVYLDQAAAQETMKKLSEIEFRYRAQIGKHPNINYDKRHQLDPSCTAEYQALGFEASIYDDWELAEAELISEES